jgi:hypothetical protein
MSPVRGAWQEILPRGHAHAVGLTLGLGAEDGVAVVGAGAGTQPASARRAYYPLHETGPDGNRRS